jgi:hypothetical protein
MVCYGAAATLYAAIGLLSFYAHLPQYVMIFTQAQEVEEMMSYKKRIPLPMVIGLAYLPDAMKVTQLGVCKALGI